MFTSIDLFLCGYNLNLAQSKYFIDSAIDWQSLFGKYR